MNTDIRVSITFKGHKKRKKLKRLLGDSYLDYLVDLWIDVALTRPNGILDGWEVGDIADAAGWEGNPEMFCRSLKEAGFLDYNGSDFKCHDWEDHQSWVVNAPAREAKARAAAQSRWDKINKKNATSNATGNATSNAKPESSNAKSNAPILSYPILSSPKDKKSRRFTPPSLSDVKEYCTKRNNQVDPESFINFYTSKGWMVGKNKMKDWKAAVRTWEKKENKGTVNINQKCQSSCFSFASCKSLGKTKIGEEVTCYCAPDNANR
jgi:hypothetical protein